jgi:hypothetical protein
VLWVGDLPTSLGEVIDPLSHLGTDVVVAVDVVAARRDLGARRFTHLIIDVERNAGPDIGFDDLALLREGGLHTGPVVFYTRRLTPERRERAEQLGASIVSDPTELLRLVSGPTPPRPIPSPPAPEPASSRPPTKASTLDDPADEPDPWPDPTGTPPYAGH